ncbi:hypothetical protein Tsubulata_013587 [Turnera subulata]|uniref:Uncharacterized protein n=1 Tax=Turnera subulata TaxID=218843 RepID=A0A9Q0FTX5_9ROSI|nr:hypothetical protein Tsubulata_013587 [Turnera subulata]
MTGKGKQKVRRQNTMPPPPPVKVPTQRSALHNLSASNENSGHSPSANNPTQNSPSASNFMPTPSIQGAPNMFVVPPDPVAPEPDAPSTSAATPNAVNSPTLQTPPATIPAVPAPSVQNDILSPFFPDSQVCVKFITETIKGHFKGPYISWKKVPEKERNQWFEEFQSAFHWPPENTPSVLRVFDHRGSVAMASGAGPNKEKEVALWVEVAGGKKKGRVYGLAGQVRLVGSTSSGFGSSGDYWEKKFEEQVKKTETLEQQLSSQSAYIKETSSRLEQLEAWMKQMQFSSSQQPTALDTGAGIDEEMDEDSEDSSTAYETGEDDEMGSEED